MSVTLDQILMLAGRLDDVPGFDSARERFRRFLVEYVRDAETLRALIRQCQHAPGDQQHRALQDLVLLAGRFLGFDVTFGAYLPGAGELKYHGHWRSRSRFHVVVEVRTDPTASAGLDSLFRAVTALTATSTGPAIRPAGLCVLTPQHPVRKKVEEALAAAKPGFPVGIVALGALVSLAEMVSAGRASHEDAVRLLEASLPVDFIVDLLEKSAGARRVERAEEVAAAGAPAGEPEYWLATVPPDEATAPKQFLELVVGKRHIFGVTENAISQGGARSGDWICFYISGTGVVGHARVQSIADNSGGIRDAHRFRQLLHLESLELHLGSPIGLDHETQLRLRTAPIGASRHAQLLVRISRGSFSALTSREARKVGARPGAVAPTEERAPESTGAPVTAGNSRSPA